MSAVSASPRISVVIPVFNEPVAVLEQSLASVMAQSFGDFEAIVVDESTRAETANACREICSRDRRFHYLRPENRIGLAASLNLGISEARGEYIARFDSDDICLPERFSTQLAYFEQHPGTGVLGGALEIISEAGEPIATRHYPADHDAIERQFMTTTAVAHPTVMIRKNLFDRFGGYDPSFRFAEDLDLWLRLLGKGVRFGNVTPVLVRYRQQDTQRKTDHWKFNLKARLRNFGLRHLPRRTVGIAAIAVWRYVPVEMQAKIFKHMLLRSR